MKNKLAYLLIAVISASCTSDTATLNGKTFVGAEVDQPMHSETLHYKTVLEFENDSVLVKRWENDDDFYRQYKGKVNRKDTVLEFTAQAYKCKHCRQAIVMVDENGKDTVLEFTAQAYKCKHCRQAIVMVDENGKMTDVAEEVQYKGIVEKYGLHLNNVHFNQD